MNKWTETVLDTPTVYRRAVNRDLAVLRATDPPVVIGAISNIDRLMLVDDKGRKYYEPIAYRRMASEAAHDAIHKESKRVWHRRRVAKVVLQVALYTGLAFGLYWSYSQATTQELFVKRTYQP